MPSLIKGKQIDADTITAANIDTTNGGISTVNAGDAAVEGSGTGVSKRDHQHSVSTAAPPSSSASAAAAAEGSASSLMRSDASIQIDVSGTLDDLAVGQAGADGSGDGVALKTHSHAVPSATAVELTDSTNSAGSGGNFVHANHQHAHGNRSGGTLHSAATPSVNGFMSAADKTKLDSLSGASGVITKDPVRVATTVAGALASDFENGDTIDGQVLVTGDRILIKNQASPIENGIYTVNASGAPTRASDMPATSSTATVRVGVDQGTDNSESIWMVTSDAPTDVVGTDAINWQLQARGAPREAGEGLVNTGNRLDVGAHVDGSIVVNADDIQVGVLATDAQHGVRGGGTQHAVAIAAGAAGFMTGSDKSKLDGIDPGAQVNSTNRQERVTTESIVNSDTVLTDVLDFTPVSDASVLLLFNGVAQIQGVGEDYTISGTAITWLASSGTAANMQTNDDLVAYYLS